MSLSAKDIKHIAKLAKLTLTEKEINQYRREISGIVKYVEHIASANVNTSEATTRLIEASDLRADSITPWDESEREAALSQAPHLKKRLVSVPRIFES